MDSKKEKIMKELFKSTLYSVLNKADNRNSELGEFKVYHFKDTDSCVAQAKLFERPPASVDKAPYSQPSTSAIPATPPASAIVNHVMPKVCLYCGKQLAHCTRRNGSCCVCAKDCTTDNIIGFADHDEEYINSNICCGCEDVQSSYAEEFMRHLNKCARKNGPKYVYHKYQTQSKSNEMSKKKTLNFFLIRKK